MKKKLFMLLITLITICGTLQAQTNKTDIVISEQCTEKKDEKVAVTFRIDIGKKAVKNGNTLLFVPTLTDRTYKWSLPAIVVQGNRALIGEQRRDRAFGAVALKETFGDDAIITKNGSSLLYQASVDWQLWMDGADLVAESVTLDCCSHKKTDDILILGNVSLPPTVAVAEPESNNIVKEEPIIDEKKKEILAPLTTGDKLAESFPFILSADQYEEIKPGQLFDEDREHALTIYFRQGRHYIEKSLEANKKSLEDLMYSIQTIEKSNDSKVKTIVIAGFTSPEGSFTLNDRLAWDRAVIVKKYIIDHSTLPDSAIVLYNGSEDWRGLRMIVEQSDMPEKERVLDIIDNTPIWDSQKQSGRLSELMRLDGGKPYLYMYNNFFPKLRNAAYIRVYFDNK